MFLGVILTLCSLLRSWVPVWSSRLHEQRKKEFKVEIPVGLLGFPDISETYGRRSFLTEDNLSCLWPTCDDGTVFTVEWLAVVTPGTYFFFFFLSYPSQCLTLYSLVECITANICLFLYTHLTLVWNVLKGRCAARSLLKRTLQIGSYYKNASKLEGNQARDQVIHMRGCSGALKNITTAPKPTFMADKWPAVVPPCVF